MFRTSPTPRTFPRAARTRAAALRTLTLVLVCLGLADYLLSAEPEPRIESPRIQRVAADLASGDSDAVTKFWAEMQDKAPLIESIPGDPEFRWITFIWLGDEATRDIVIYGAPPNKVMTKPSRLGNSDLWFKTDKIPKDSRFGYAFQINGGRIQLDPLNPRSFAGRSVVELPDAPVQPWILPQPGVPRGARVQLTLKSKLLNEERALAVYTPPGYASERKACALLIVFDGESYGYSTNSAIQVPVILDRLLAAGKIPRIIAVLVNSQKTRDRDLVCSPRFAQFLAEELVQWVRSNYRVSKKPSNVILAGSSYGGLCATFAAWKYPKVFGNVLSQSGSFGYYPEPHPEVVPYSEETGWLIRQFVATPAIQTRFYLQVGVFEAPMLPDHRRLRDVLEAKGCAVTYSELSGGHDYLTWRSSFASGLVALVGACN